MTSSELLSIMAEGDIFCCFMEDHIEHTFENVASHCKQHASLVRGAFGTEVCVFKIGITHNPITRFPSYRKGNFAAMYLLHCSGSVDFTNALEKCLIESFQAISGCRNIRLGGDGSMARFEAPYYLYIVAARADGRLRIAWV